MKKVGFIGLGKIAQLKHLKYVCQHAEMRIDAICDRCPSLLEQIRVDLSIDNPFATTSAADLLTRNLDLVFVLNHNHFPIVEAFIDARIPVFCEKPLAWSLPDAERLLNLSMARNTWLAVGYTKRHDPLVMLLKDIVLEYGPPLYVNCVNLAGGVKQWTDNLYSIRRPDDDEKIEEKQRLDVEMELSSIGLLEEAKKILLNLASHTLDIFSFIDSANEVRIAHCSFVHHHITNSSAITVIAKKLNCIINITCIPLFSSPWLWDERIDFVYADKKLTVQFDNPFLSEPGSHATIIHRTSRGTVSEEFSFGRIDPFKCQIEWINSQLTKNPVDFESAKISLATQRAIDECIKLLNHDNHTIDNDE